MKSGEQWDRRHIAVGLEVNVETESVDYYFQKLDYLVRKRR